MGRLLLLRHAKAVASQPGLDDYARALDERGHREATIIGAYMAKHHMIADRVLLSPSRRTQETWKYAAAAFSPLPTVTAAEPLYDAAPHTILDVIGDAGAAAKTLLVIAHNPGLHEAALMLIASGDIDIRERLREGMPTAGLAVIDFTADDWRALRPQSGRLERFVTPRTLEQAAN